MKRLIMFFAVLAVVALLGCNNKVPFGGKVTYSDDGLPLTVGFVVFTTATYTARGQLQQDGSYQLASVGTNDGLPPGKYRVYIMGAYVDKNGESVSLINLKRASPKETDLEVEVVAGKRTFDFTVDRFVPNASAK